MPAFDNDSLYGTVGHESAIGMGWRGIADVLAVGSYLFGVVPLFGISLLEIGVIGRGKTEEEKLKLHAVFVAIFLVVAHVAMIFGMLDPKLLSHGAGMKM